MDFIVPGTMSAGTSGRRKFLLASVEQHQVGRGFADLVGALQVDYSKGGHVLHFITNLLEGHSRIRVQNERGNTASVRAGHRCSTEDTGGCGVSNPSSQNVGSRGENVSTFSVVGEIGTNVNLSVIRIGSEIGSSDCDAVRRTGRRGVASITVVVSSSSNHHNTSCASSVNSSVNRVLFATSQGHVGGGWLATLLFFRNTVVNSGDDVSPRSRTSSVQDFNSNKVDSLADSVFGSTDS